jgi:hypothetical protein
VLGLVLTFDDDGMVLHSFRWFEERGRLAEAAEVKRWDEVRGGPPHTVRSACKHRFFLECRGPDVLDGDLVVLESEVRVPERVLDVLEYDLRVLDGAIAVLESS